MGICCSCCSGKSNADPAPARPPPPPPPPLPPPVEPVPEPDPVPSSVGNDIDSDSFLGSNISHSTWFSMATNVTTMLSQVSGAIAAFWENNTKEDNELAAVVDEKLPDVGTVSDSKLRAFTFAQLRAATSNFRSHMFLGKGGFGSVYKGLIKENVPSLGTKKRAIAVKMLDEKSKQGVRQWRTEVGFLARLSHPNIVKILGYCKEDEKFLIVYEFMKKGSLNYHLFSKSQDHVLSWPIRVKVMAGMARGLSYLHMMEKPIIYRDFKSSNVLLDESYNAKISDFGLAKWGPAPGNSYVEGNLMGTKGYAAPEYIAEGRLYVKSDVYSFGVVLVEMLTGLRAIDKGRPCGQQNLVGWMIPSLFDKRRLKNRMDSRLEGKYSIKEALRISALAGRCLDSQPKFRPSMKEVADNLETIEASYRT